jgi:hypothetical protein
VLESVCGAATLVMGGKAGLQILCGADVEAAVSTADNVNVVYRNVPRLASLARDTIRLGSNVLSPLVACHERALFASRMVEAGGIEPPSESLPSR